MKPKEHWNTLHSIIKVYQLLLDTKKIGYNGSAFRRMIELENRLKR